jgi:hypothetical protein
MRKILTVTAAAAALALATVAAPQQAEAGHSHVAGAIIGGLAVGALIGAAAANGGYYYAPGPYYYAPGPYYYGPECYWTRQRVWNGYGWYTRRIRVCD